MKNQEGLKNHEWNNSLGELSLFYQALNGVRNEVDRLLLLAHDIEEGEIAGNISLEELKRGIKNLPSIVNTFVEKVSSGDKEALKVLLKENISRYSAKLISSNMELLSPEVQDWLQMIREGKRKITTEDMKRLRELSSSLRRSFPTEIEKWIQQHIWEGFGRKADYTKLHGMFDVQNHAKKHCQESV